MKVNTLMTRHFMRKKLLYDLGRARRPLFELGPAAISQGENAVNSIV